MNASWLSKIGMPRSEFAATGVTLVDRPVEAGHAVVALDALGLEHDVVAGLGIVVAVAGPGIEHVVADDGRVEEQLRVLARQGVEARSALEPVVTLVAEQEVAAVAAAG